MKHLPWILVAITLFTIVPYTANASIEIRAKKLTATDGLANNSIRHIYQDSKGFIWFSTLNGLSRYDGNSFVMFRPTRGEELSLADHRVRNTKEDSNGFLWITTSAERISCYDLKRDCFVDYTGCGEVDDRYDEVTILSDGEVWLWGRTQGCRKITWQEGVFNSEVFTTANGRLQSDYVRFFKQTGSGLLWIGTDKGLYLYGNGTLRAVDTGRRFLQHTVINDVNYFITSEGIIWKWNRDKLEVVSNLATVAADFALTGNLQIGTQWLLLTNRGGFLFDNMGDTIRTAPEELNIANGLVQTDNRGNYWIYNQTGYVNYVIKESGAVTKIDVKSSKYRYFVEYERYQFFHDSRNIIWIGTHRNGLFAYDPSTGAIDHFSAGANNASPISSNYIQCISEDRSGNIWVSSEFTGVSQIGVINNGAEIIYPEGKSNIDRDNTVRVIYPTSNGDMFITTREGGLYTYDEAFSTLKNKKLYNASIYSIEEDKDGVMWLGSRAEGIRIGDRLYANDPADGSSLAADAIFSILEDSRHRMWIGTFGGGLDLAIPYGDKYIFHHFFNKTNVQREIRTLCEDRNGWIWVGTSEGVFVFHPDRLIADPDDYYQYNLDNGALKSNEVKSIMEDTLGRIWIAESGVGFCVGDLGEDYDNMTFTHYGVSDGLVHSVVQAIMEDNDGHIWISTEFGISCFNPDTKLFNNYFFSSEMLGNVYTEGCAKLKDGRLAFGTNYGLMLLDTKRVKEGDNVPSVTFTDLKLNGISVHPTDADSPLKAALAYTNAIELKHFQNSFVVDFSTFDYLISANSRFSYTLEGYDSDWSVPSTFNFAAYKNVPAGTYHLRVKARNASGVWSEEEAVLEIKIAQLFWTTGWAFLIYLIFSMVIIYFAFRVIRDMTTLRNRVEIERQLTEYKLVFFTNISHEFRTPLTLIRGALDKIDRLGSIPRDMLYPIKVMDKSTRRMLRLINQLLEFRKMQNGRMPLSLERTDIVAFLYEIYVIFTDAAESKNMDYSFRSSAPSHNMYIDKSGVDKIAYNLLSNAFKYTPSGGRVEMDVSVDGQNRLLIIKVSDTGTGVPKEKRNDLFKRYMPVSLSGNSMGMGLYLTRELVDVHKGTIRYEENLEGGSIFVVTIPTDPSVYDPGDFLVVEKAIVSEDSQEDHAPTGHDYFAGEPEVAADAPLNKLKILIIEDDNDVREFLIHELNPYFEVAAATDGTNGLEYARDNDIDLIVSDVVMPGHSGFELTRELKNDFTTSHIPIILLTALDNGVSHLEGVRSGADAYITKPFSPRLLQARIFKLIEQRDKLKEKFSRDITFKKPILCTTDKDKVFLDNLNRILEEQLSNPEFTVDDFVSMMMLGRTIFYRKVRGLTGYTPKEYLRVVRMKRAAELLSDKQYTVSEVAYMVGLNDPFYFSRCFKTQFGISPSQYQNDRTGK
jgi:signal transduction histidine kinase/ligand-binding sensor domain-containing protein/DNA-binding response OmpR family regulator